MKPNISLRCTYSLEKTGDLYFHTVTFDDVKIKTVILQPKAEALAKKYNLQIKDNEAVN